MEPIPLTARSKAARLLKLWVRIPPGTWMSLCCECCVLSSRGLCDELITRAEESYWMWCVLMWSWSLYNKKVLAHWWLNAVCVCACRGREENKITKLLLFYISELSSKAICVQIRKRWALIFLQTPSVPVPDNAVEKSVFCDVIPGTLKDTDECCRAT
jgi:hypothetical protein